MSNASSFPRRRESSKTITPRSGQNPDVASLCGNLFKRLDSRLRGNDGFHGDGVK